MTETLNRPGPSQAEQRAAIRKKRLEHVSGLNPQTETLHSNTIQVEELMLRKKQLEQARELGSQVDDTRDLEPSEVIAESSAFETSDVNIIEDDRSVSPFADRIRNATERFANRLEKRALSKSHSEALNEYRDSDHSGYVDHVASLASTEDESVLPEAKTFNQNLLKTEEKRTDQAEAREAMKEYAEVQLRMLGNIAMEKTVDAKHVAVGLGIVGYKAIQKRAQTALFNHTTKRQNEQFKKQYVKETAKFDKQSEKNSLKLGKVEAKEMKAAKKIDQKFEKSMDRKRTFEKWEDRIVKAGDKYRTAKAYPGIKREATIQKMESGAAKLGETYRNGKESYESIKTRTIESKRKLGRGILHLKNVGSSALDSSPKSKR